MDLMTALPRESHRHYRDERDDPFFPIDFLNSEPVTTVPVFLTAPAAGAVHIAAGHDVSSASAAESESLDPDAANDPGLSTGLSATMAGALQKVDSQRTIVKERTGNMDERGWRRVVRNFTPSWFAVNMGTGIVSILLYELPYNAPWVRDIGIAFFLLNVALFIIFSCASILRYIIYPEVWGAMIAHPAQSLFLGCFPMGFATIVNMVVLVCGEWGPEWVYLAWGLWWFDAVISLACCISMPFVVMHRHRPSLPQLTAALLLPIVPAVVAAASGALVAQALLPISPQHAVLTTVVGYVLFGIGELFTLLVLTLYFHRLHVHSLPPREAIVSVFLPVGPLGQGGFAIQKLGAVMLSGLPLTGTLEVTEGMAERVGEFFYSMGVFCALLMWGFGLVWLAYALITIATMKRFPFNMGWWGFTFPLGVFTTCTGQLGHELESRFLLLLTTILSLCVVALWVVVGSRTVKMVMTREIFVAPCLKVLEEKKQDQRREEARRNDSAV